MRNQLERYVRSLLNVLSDGETPIENQTEILEKLKNIAEINGLITKALIQYSQKVENGGTKTNSGIKDEKLSLWIKTQAELIRRKHFQLIELHKRQNSLNTEFYINLAFDGVVILAGGLLFFIPAVGPSVSIPLIAGRVLAITKVSKWITQKNYKENS